MKRKVVEATFEYIGTLISEKGKEKDFHQLLVADAKRRGWVGLGLSVVRTLSVGKIDM